MRIDRLEIRNFRSIAEVDLPAGALNLVVGRNGSGKSNLIDSVRFVSEALSAGLETAIRRRHGLDRIRRFSSTGHPPNVIISIHLRDFATQEGRKNTPAFASYSISIATLKEGNFRVSKEEISVLDKDKGRMFYFLRTKGKNRLEISEGLKQARNIVDLIGDSRGGVFGLVPPESLLFPFFGRLPVLSGVFSSLTDMEFYSIDPNLIRQYNQHGPGVALVADGSNLASVLRNMEKQSSLKSKREALLRFLQQIIPGIEDVKAHAIGASDLFYIAFSRPGSQKSVNFYPQNLSDGTIRALALLAAMFHSKRRNRVVFVEEPEIAIHPGASLVIMDAIALSAADNQLFVTTHSPSILEHESVKADNIRGLTNKSGETRLALVSTAARQTMTQELLTAGELMSKGHLFIE
jgi:predicted ATPase